MGAKELNYRMDLSSSGRRRGHRDNAKSFPLLKEKKHTFLFFSSQYTG